MQIKNLEFVKKDIKMSHRLLVFNYFNILFYFLIKID